MRSKEVLALIKKYSFFEENDLNKYELDRDEEVTSIEFSAEAGRSHECCINMDGGSTIKIYKSTGISKFDKLTLCNIVSKINKLITIPELDIRQIDSILKDEVLKNIIEHLNIPCKDKNVVNFLYDHIKEMECWASQTYENMKICFGIGINCRITSDGPKLSEFYQDDMLKVLTSGITTLIICDKYGNINSFLTDTGNRCNDATEAESLCAFNWIQSWSSEKIAIILTSRSDILIFSNGKFEFVQRRSKWHKINLDGLTHWMNENQRYDSSLKKAIAETCLDVSFRHTGACLGIIDEINLEYLVYDEDIIAKSKKPRIDFFKKIIGNKKFQELPREIRQELAAIDGALVLKKDGTILSIGAILKITHLPQDNRTTGGRSVAAQQLACYGFGIKISADGSITAWRNKKIPQTGCPYTKESPACKTTCNHEKYFELF